MISATDGTRMARTKGKPAKSEPPRKHLGIRARVDWAEWLEEAAEFCRTDTAKLIDESLIHYLQKRGFKKKPPPRL